MSKGGSIDPGTFHHVPLEIGKELEGDDNMDNPKTSEEEKQDEDDEDS